MAFLVLVFPSELMDFCSQHGLVHMDIHETEIFLFLRGVANICQVINFSFNFVLYCAVNVQFRQTLCKLLNFQNMFSCCRNSNTFVEGTSIQLHSTGAIQTSRPTGRTKYMSIAIMEEKGYKHDIQTASLCLSVAKENDKLFQ